MFFKKDYIVNFVEEYSNNEYDLTLNINIVALVNPTNATNHQIVAAVYAAIELENCRAFCDSTNGLPAYDGFIDMAKELAELHAWLAENK